MIHKKGNLLEADEDIIGHGCNCMGSMGAGVAKQIKEVYPKAYEEYKKITPDKKLLGEMQIVHINEDRIVLNLFTQVFYGRKHKKFDYNNFHIIADKLSKLGFRLNKNIALPRVGAGYAKGNWKKIERILKIHEDDVDNFEFVIYTL